MKGRKKRERNGEGNRKGVSKITIETGDGKNILRSDKHKRKEE